MDSIEGKGVIVKARDFIVTAILLAFAQGFAFADRQLERAEILQVFQTLTAQPRDTWVSAGIIKAKHNEFKSSYGCTIDSTVIVKYDGDRFYWEIDIDSQISEAPTNDTPFFEGSDLEWNKKRVFAWDGRRYTTYFRPGNDAIVSEEPGGFSSVARGPLTAGIVPWGHGFYSYKSLSEIKSSAVEVKVGNRKQIQLTLESRGGRKWTFVLDPGKEYAVLSSSSYNNHSSVSKSYENYEKVSGRWIPNIITIEHYDNKTQTPELISYDYWEFIQVDTNPLTQDSFGVAYEPGAFIEYHSSITDGTLSYYYSDYVDTELLLQNRLAIAAENSRKKQNCATAAMRYVVEKLGKGVDDKALAGLVEPPNRQTSLYELKQFARESGFYCLAVKTDIQTLRALTNCQAILYLPKEKHYVALSHIDDDYAWIVDLDNDRFYDRIELEIFKTDWDGYALLVSVEPINLEGCVLSVSDENLHKIIGADDGFGTYSCTDKIQYNDIVLCEPMKWMMCGSICQNIFERYACRPDPDGGECRGEPMIGSRCCVCVESLYWPGECTWSDEWYSRYIRACK